MLVYFMAIWNVLRPKSIGSYSTLVFLWSFKIDFYRFGMFYQEKSGSPGCEG
jgi:hypothetical protein